MSAAQALAELQRQMAESESDDDCRDDGIADGGEAAACTGTSPAALAMAELQRQMSGRYDSDSDSDVAANNVSPANNVVNSQRGEQDFSCSTWKAHTAATCEQHAATCKAYGSNMRATCSKHGRHMNEPVQPVPNRCINI